MVRTPETKYSVQCLLWDLSYITHFRHNIEEVSLLILAVGIENLYPPKV